MQISFSWSVSFCRRGHRVWFSSPNAWTYIRLHCFIPGVMLFGEEWQYTRAAASVDSSRHHQMLPFSSCLFPSSLVPRHRFLPICPVVGLVAFGERFPPTQRRDVISKSKNQAEAPHSSRSASDGRPTCLLAYECCRVKSKSFSRFLRCSLLQTSSPPCFPSSPPSSCLFWVLVGCSEQEQAINRKSRSFLLFFFFFL